MTIRNKLFLGFGSLLGLVLLLFLINISSVWNQAGTRNSMKKATDSSISIEKLRYQMAENLSNLNKYLLSGNVKDLNAFESGRAQFGGLLKQASINSVSTEQTNALNDVKTDEQAWYDQVAAPRIKERKDVVAGNGRNFYQSQDPATSANEAIKSLDTAAGISQRELENERSQDDSAAATTKWVLVVATLITLVLGYFIAHSTATRITQPLMQLMTITRQITESGDLEQSFVIARKD